MLELPLNALRAFPGTPAKAGVGLWAQPQLATRTERGHLASGTSMASLRTPVGLVNTCSAAQAAWSAG
jgi:hypothetical protein